ncbi:MAG: 2-oxoisovalerate dehydrogenase subunit beta [Chlamydiota bacterium]|jgi:2-oxoisovalerate dehydrogenase E1 component
MIQAPFSCTETKALLKAMYTTRFADEKMQKLIRQNKGGTFHLSVLGHEMVGALCALELIPGKDWGLPYYRDRAFAIGLGCPVDEIIASCLARDVPHHSGGRMMPEHFTHKELRIPCQSSCVGSQFLQAVGVAKAVQLQGKNEVVYVSAGDGATSQGDFHEALNFASLHRLGVIFVIQDNGWAISVPSDEQTAGGSIAHMARGYQNLSVFDVDGCHYEELQPAVAQAVEKARKGEGPSVIVAHVPRIGAHSSSDDPSKYKDAACVASDLARDPLPRFEQFLLKEGLLTQSDIDILKEECFQAVEEAAVRADQMPFPNPDTAADKVFAPVNDTEWQVREDAELSSESVVMMDALNHALDEEMAKDPSVVVFGQDVAKGKGGVFGITRHLTEKHGEARCFNSPLAESSIMGIAMGMAMAGIKPVVEIQFADYMWTGVNQLFNEIASLYYRANAEFTCPLVIRMPSGGYIQGGPYHSQSIEAFLAHAPGLKVVIPSNAADAKRLLKAAIRDPNPVVFLEHKALYRQRVFSARKEPLADEMQPFGKAQIVKEGSDVTVVAWGMTVFMASQIADSLAQEGIKVEVIDLRTIVPWDSQAVLASVRKTGKLLIAHEANKSCGFGAEIAATVMEQAFHYLDAPIMRIGAKDCPVPYSKGLEDRVLPQLKDIEEGIRTLHQM